MQGIGSWGSSSSSYAYSALALGTLVGMLAGYNCWHGIGSYVAEKRIQVWDQLILLQECEPEDVDDVMEGVAVIDICGCEWQVVGAACKGPVGSS